MSRRGAQGVTLVELVVAMTLGLSLVVLLSQALGTTRHAWERGRALADRGSRAADAHESLRRLITGMAAAPAGEAAPFDASERAFDFVTTPSLGLRKQGSMRARLWVRDDGGQSLSLVLSLAPLHGPDGAAPSERVLLSNLHAAHLAYRYRSPAGVSHEPPHVGARPDLVIVAWNTAAEPARRWTVAVRPRVDTAGGCASDLPGGMRCTPP